MGCYEYLCSFFFKSTYVVKVPYESKPVKLETSYSVILPTVVSVLWFSSVLALRKRKQFIAE